MIQELPTQEINPPSNTSSRVSPRELLATHNPALARLAATIVNQDKNTITNYSRLHHRHNRS